MSDTQLTPQGFAVVPQKPSPEMLLAGAAAAGISPAAAYAAFAAMLATAKAERDDGQREPFSLL